MITFFVAPALLLGYLTYGKVVEHIFGPDDRPTPAAVMADGVDYVEMPTWKVFLIQLLNIAGTGPIFGALAVIGVVACPITSGDTALRSARLILADWFHIDQSKIGKRLALTIPPLGLVALLTQLDFDVV